MNETKQAKFTRGDWATYSSNTGRSSVGGIGVYREYPMESIAHVEFASSLTTEEVEANAYLIAAAPDLYEALNRYYRWDRDIRDIQHKAADFGLPVPEFPESSGYMDGWLQQYIRGPVEQALAKADGPAVGHTDLF